MGAHEQADQPHVSPYRKRSRGDQSRVCSRRCYHAPLQECGTFIKITSLSKLLKFNQFVTHSPCCSSPLPCKTSLLAPDLISVAVSAGMDPAMFQGDVAAFLEGGVSSDELIKRRSVVPQRREDGVANSWAT